MGSGPFIVDGRRAGDAAVMRTWQIIVRSDNTPVRRDLGNLLMYEYADTHEHWHLHGFARYELRWASKPGVVVRSRKQGFCLGDRYDAFPETRLPREPRLPIWTHDCGLGHTDARTMREGISPGFGDDYAPGLEGQYVNLEGVRAGRYLLVHRTNPAGLIREEDYTNNASSVLLELRRPTGRKPTVRVLRRCPDSLRCQPASTRAGAPSSESRIARMSAASPTKIGTSRSV